MKTEIAEVKSKSAIVAKVEIPVFENIQEAFNNLGEDKCLALINTQNGTNIKNEARARATGMPSKASLKNMAISRLIATRPNDLMAVQGDLVKLEALLNEEVSKIEAELEASKKAAIEANGGDEDAAE